MNEFIANVVGAGLAPPRNKISNSNAGRPRPTPTIIAIKFIQTKFKGGKHL